MSPRGLFSLLEFRCVSPSRPRLPTRRRERRLRFWSALLLPAQVSSLKNESRAVRRGGIARKIGNFAILGREDDDERHVGPSGCGWARGVSPTVAHAARALMASVCRVWTSIRSAGGSISVHSVVFRCFPLYCTLQDAYPQAGPPPSQGAQHHQGHRTHTQCRPGLRRPLCRSSSWRAWRDEALGCLTKSRLVLRRPAVSCLTKKLTSTHVRLFAKRRAPAATALAHMLRHRAR